MNNKVTKGTKGKPETLIRALASLNERRRRRAAAALQYLASGAPSIASARTSGGAR